MGSLKANRRVTIDHANSVTLQRHADQPPCFFSQPYRCSIVTDVIINTIYGSDCQTICVIYDIDLGILLVCGFALIFALLPLFHTIFCPQTFPLPLP